MMKNIYCSKKIKQKFTYYLGHCLFVFVVFFCWDFLQASVFQKRVFILQNNQIAKYQRFLQLFQSDKYETYPNGYCWHLSAGQIRADLVRPLLSRICDDDYSGVRLLIDTGRNRYNPDQIWSMTGENPLIIAAKKGNIHIVYTLVLDYGVRVCWTDDVGMSAANWADELRFLAIADFLYDRESQQDCDTL